MAGIALILAACQTVPYTNRRHLVLVPQGEELALGEQQYRKALAEAKPSTDAGAIEQVRRVGERLAAAADRPDYKWEFNVIEDPKTINAWCLPGGKVAVYTGILPVAQDDSGLAVVLGHEIAHALARHGGERISQGLIAQLGGAALGAAMANKPQETQQLATAAYGLGATVGVLLPFSREQESEADRIGLILMAKAGYDPSAAVGFWERMQKAAGGAEDPLQKYLGTHPPTSERIRDIQKHLPEAQGYFHHSGGR